MRRPTLRRPTLRRPTLRRPTLRRPTLRRPTVRRPTLRRPTLRRPTVRRPTLRRAKRGAVHSPGRWSAGFVTAEVAVLLPALTLLTALCVSMVGAAVVHVRCLDAARTGARAVSRDEPVDAVLAETRARAPAGAEVTLERLPGGLVAVEVTATAHLAGHVGPGIRVGGDVVAAAEGVP